MQNINPGLYPSELRPTHGGTQPQAPSSPERKATRSLLTDVFPTFMQVINGGATSIGVPDATFTTLTTGWTGWYPLIDIPVETLGQEVLLFSWQAIMVSTEYNATGTNHVWGNVRGEAAALVVGDGNLPMSGTASPAWRQAPCDIPSVEAAGTGLLAQSRFGQYVDYVTFPPGSYADAIPFKWVYPRNWAPWVYRFPFGSRLQVALAVRGSQVRNVSGAAHTLRCGIIVQLHVGKTETTTGFTR